MFTGLSGGFFFSALAAAERKTTRQRERRTRTERDRHGIVAALCYRHILKSITPRRVVRRPTADCLGCRRPRGCRRARLAIRFARGRLPARFACSLNRDTFWPLQVNLR